MNLDTTADDLNLLCCDCDEMFVFSAGEQAYFAARLLHQPRRCRPCRVSKRQEREAAAYLPMMTWEP
jgi:ornithine cyclodeaminase/alanine dehydrogenase-like protein (mu-crystallin family)